MPRVSKDFIEELRETIDIVDLISDYVDLKKTGKNYIGLCPFHQEKTPSFTINPEKKLYYCFGCGAGGDVFNFLMEIEHITFRESLKILASRVGLSIPDQSPATKRINAERERLFEINQLAAKFYHYLLMKTKVGLKAIAYLKKRGFTQEDIKQFYLGYAPQSWHSLLKFLTDKGYTQTELVKSGLALRGSNNYYDRFRERIIFPIFNIRGEVLAFGGRIINNTDKALPKYLNSPDSLIFKKGNNLYGFNWAREKIRETGNAMIMEGYLDILTAHKAGITNAVASLGTALTPEQARLLKRYASSTYIAYDGDIAGTKATMRGLDILKDVGLNVKVINLPEGMDPDEFIKENGRIEFENLKGNAMGLLDFKIDQIIGDRDYTEPEVKINLTREIISLLSGLEDKIEREIYLQKIADRFQLDIKLLKEELVKLNHKHSKKKDNNYKKRYTKKDNETNSFSNINRLERMILQAFINYPELRNNICKEIQPEFFSKLYQKSAKLLWENLDKDIQLIIDNIKDDDLRKKLLSLTVVRAQSLSPKKVESLIMKLKEHSIYQFKLSIYEYLQSGEDISLNQINDFLLSFQQLSNYQGKEVF